MRTSRLHLSIARRTSSAPPPPRDGHSLRLGRLPARIAAIAAVAAGAAAAPLAAGSSAAATATGPTVITTAPSAFGTMLVVGSGKFAGYSLYYITSDQPGHYGCTVTIIKSLPGGAGSCTGPAADQKAEWPALTTTGAPKAGAGVSQKLLGSVDRAGIGVQVTYAGHPLYLFDQGPGQITGEAWDEPTLPPWHGVWMLMSPTGLPLAWPGALTTTTIGGKTVLATDMLTGAGWEAFPVYSYSADTSSASACTGSCAVAWPPVITSGAPGVTAPLAKSSVATIKRGDGTEQITYDGKPLYLDGSEKIAPSGVGYAATGSGNGVTAGGGTFELVTP